MGLSVCLIARNEAGNLPRALDSVAGVADELVVVDTGSTDQTVDIARERGARLGHFPWCDDFAAARNAALELASADWVLWLDADEELLPASIPALQRCQDDPGALAYLVQRQDLVAADRPEQYTVMWQLRLFRRLPELRFRGHCHPDFHPSAHAVAGARGQRVLPSSVTLRHYGYLGDLRQSKLQRACRLLELELQARPGQLYYQIEYGRTLLALGQARGAEVLEQATRQVLEHRNAARAPAPMVAALFEYLLRTPDVDLPAGLDRPGLETLIRRWFPTAAPLRWLMAEQAFSRGDFVATESLLRSLIEMGVKHSYDRHISFDPRILGEDAHMNLAVCLIRQARLQEAAAYLKPIAANRQSPRAEEARINLEAIRKLKRQQGRAGARRPGKRRRR